MGEQAYFAEINGQLVEVDLSSHAELRMRAEIAEAERDSLKKAMDLMAVEFQAAIEYREQAEEYDQLLGRLGELLTGVANALKGDPPDLVMHDWSDLPRVAQELVEERNRLLVESKEAYERCAEIEQISLDQIAINEGFRQIVERFQAMVEGGDLPPERIEAIRAFLRPIMKRLSERTLDD